MSLHVTIIKLQSGSTLLYNLHQSLLLPRTIGRLHTVLHEQLIKLSVFRIRSYDLVNFQTSLKVLLGPGIIHLLARNSHLVHIPIDDGPLVPRKVELLFNLQESISGFQGIFNAAFGS